MDPPAPQCMEFSRLEYWSELPFPAPGDLPDPGTKLMCLLHWQADSLPLCHLGSPYGSSSFNFFEKLTWSRVAAAIYIPTNNAQAFFFLHILTSIFYIIFLIIVV